MRVFPNLPIFKVTFAQLFLLGLEVRLHAMQILIVCGSKIKIHLELLVHWLVLHQLTGNVWKKIGVLLLLALISCIIVYETKISSVKIQIRFVVFKFT